MSELELRLRKAIEQSANRGFQNFTIMSDRGDSNCPHPVPYHPEDGHGFDDEKIWFDLTSDGKLAAFDVESDYGDPLEVLCRIFESLPPIKDRDLIK